MSNKPFTLVCAFAGCSVIAFMCSSAAFAQQSGSQLDSQQQVTPGVSVNAAQKGPLTSFAPVNEQAPGIDAAGYELKQSAEVGGRITDYTGNVGTWDTYVNLGTGARLLEYSLDMHSPDHKGFLFD